MSTTPVAPLILVVDDNPLNVEPLCELLAAMGYRVDQALDGRTALRISRERLPDLILLDVMMPGMNGFEVCEQLKRDPVTEQIPVVFVTALSETEDKLRGIEVGGDDFLTKPFNRPILLARVRSLLRLKAARDEIDASYRKLQALERLKDDLMKMIVHDLKSPLTGIMGTIEMALDGELGEISDELRTLLEDGAGRGTEALQLMDDLLELTRLEESRVSLALDPVHVGYLLTSIAEEWRIRVEQQGGRIESSSESDREVLMDQHLIRRVFANLVGNALRHGGESLHIELSVTDEKEAGACFTVRDNGIGIPPAYHDLIFRKFTGVREVKPGNSGLGLTFAKLAVEAHDGRIWVESDTGNGAAFHFTIPGTLDPDAAREAPEMAPAS